MSDELELIVNVRANTTQFKAEMKESIKLANELRDLTKEIKEITTLDEAEHEKRMAELREQTELMRTMSDFIKTTKETE